MKLSKREAKAYVEDDRHWAVIGVTDYIRVRRLVYKNLSYIAIETKRMNMASFYMEHKVVIEWTKDFYYTFDAENNCLSYSIRPTQMIDEIWEESKK